MLQTQPDCPKNWEYEDAPNSGALVTNRSIRILKILRSLNPLQKAAAAKDTRPAHSFLFKSLTPTHFPYYAGHYRGEPFRCLQHSQVGVKSDPNVGHVPATVPMEMTDFGRLLDRAVDQLDLVFQAPTALFSQRLKVFRAVEIAAALFVHFLEIHPYANGNGHMARMLLICLLGRHGMYPNANWKVHPRPSDPRYSDAIKAYRKGNPKPLLTLLLDCL